METIWHQILFVSSMFVKHIVLRTKMFGIKYVIGTSKCVKERFLSAEARPEGPGGAKRSRKAL